MQAENYSIKKWAKDDKPREKLLTKSAAALSDAELIAILINHGTRQKSALDLAREILFLGNNSLNELGKLSIDEFMTIKGIGMAKAVTIAAALEIGRRRQAGTLMNKTALKDSKDVAQYMQSILKDQPRELFAVVFLNQANRVNHFEIISQGGITGTVADPRIILKKALEKSAVSLILCHNHPSGSLKPSRADEELTHKIKEAAKFFDIKVLDHLIVSEEGYYQFCG